jgi:hypothetical protein
VRPRAYGGAEVAEARGPGEEGAPEAADPRYGACVVRHRYREVDTPGRGPIARLCVRTAALAIALIAAFAVANAQAAVVALPRVSAETEEIRSASRPAIVLHSLLVRRIDGKLTVRCNRCRRLVGRIRVRRTSPTTTRFSGVNWILRGGRAVKLTVVRRGRIGRYLLLTAKRQGGLMVLGYKASGCLDRHRNRVLCPRAVRPVQPDQVVPPREALEQPTPPPTPTPTPTPRPAPAPPWQAVSPAHGKASVLCGGVVTVIGAYNPAREATNGKALIRACLVYYRNSAGNYYYQGVLEVKYNESWPGASDLFSGKSMSAISGTPQATGVADCPRITWGNGDLLWCYSPTVTFVKGPGAKLYAKGVLIDQAGKWHPVWSPTLTTA